MKQKICDCGWKSELYPDGTLFAGLGGQLGCPDCTKLERNPNIEVYGHVHVIDVPPFKGWRATQGRQRRLIHYFENGKAVCGAKVSNDGEYLIKDHWDKGFSAKCLSDWGKEFCPRCEETLKNRELAREKALGKQDYGGAGR